MGGVPGGGEYILGGIPGSLVLLTLSVVYGIVWYKLVMNKAGK